MTIRSIVRSIREKGAAATALDMEIRSGKRHEEFMFGRYDAFEFLTECFDSLTWEEPGGGEDRQDEYAERYAKFMEMCPGLVNSADPEQTADMMRFYERRPAWKRLRRAVLKAIGPKSQTVETAKPGPSNGDTP